MAAVRKPPKVEAQEVEILSPDQVKAVLGSLWGHSLHPIAMLGLTTGMRRGELLALQWSDINLDANVVTINRSLRGNESRVAAEAAKDKTQPSQYRLAG